MTPKEAFKAGFLEKCAADGLDTAQAIQRVKHAKFMLAMGALEKTAAGGTFTETVVSPVKDLLSKLISGGYVVGGVAPPLAGLVGGAMLAKAQETPYDPDEMRKREEAAEYELAVQQLQNIKKKQQAQV